MCKYFVSIFRNFKKNEFEKFNGILQLNKYFYSSIFVVFIDTIIILIANRVPILFRNIERQRWIVPS